MSVSPGSRLGPYEITAKLGEGGMGEVYRAKDSQLGRSVALKVLPEGFTSDPERLARFEREAKLLAQLNHPNIAQIYGLEASGETRALVMELVEGPTLAERLEAGPLPLNECLSVSLQIAHALEEAHEKGIVHRDLKPQNIKASPEGKVKVLDFGLAKALDPPSTSAMSADDMARSPTVTFGATREGVILGTAAYMSPEQARGGAVDKRTDIWAFGVVLYEMLAGERLFAEASVVDTLSAVMRKPIDFARLPAVTPRPLRDLLRRCLERNPKNRLHDIADARLVLAELVAAPEGELAAASEAAITPPSAHSRWLTLAAVGLGAALVGALVGSRLAELRRPAAMPSFRFEKLTYLPGVEWAPELSADGRALYFAAGDPYGESELYSVPVGGKKPTSLTPGVRAFHEAPRLSPEGNRLVFASDRDGGGLFLMGVNGESVRRLSEVGHDPAWSPDGRSIVYSTYHAFAPWEGIDGGTLGVVDVASGARRELASGDGRQAVWSPSGRRIAYWGLRAGGDRELWTIGAAGGEPVAVASDPAIDWNPVWSEDGTLLYFLSDRGGAMNLWRVAIDEETGRQRGAPESVPLPADEVIYLARSGRRWVYAAYSARSNLLRFDFDPERAAVVGGPHAVLSTTRSVRSAAVSPDGRFVGFTTMRPQDDLYVVESVGGNPTQLTDDPEFDRYVSWSPDGRHLLYQSFRGGKYEVYRIRPDGSSLEKLTETEEDPGWSPVLSPRGDRLVMTLREGLALFDASGPPPWRAFERIPPPADLPGSNFSRIRWSPAGDRLAGNAYRGNDNEPRRAGVLDLGTLRHRFFDPPSWPVGWFPDGRRLLIVHHRRLAVLDLDTWRAAPVPGSPEIDEEMSASRDLRTLVLLEEDRQADIWLAEEIPASGSR